MNCANYYCLHNKRFECTLGEINIDSMGVCDECILVKFNVEIVEYAKNLQSKMMKKATDNS